MRGAHFGEPKAGIQRRNAVFFQVGTRVWHSDRSGPELGGEALGTARNRGNARA